MLGALVIGRAWEPPAVGGAVLDRWPDNAAAVALRLSGHDEAVSAVLPAPLQRTLTVRSPHARAPMPIPPTSPHHNNT
ncbi:hypothetical protein [Streptomyces sp. UNOC14_S4]|uniref:hypothetical protein n=1 Tax=Streptomyces sp. UNOC14_S4 TaxID=2872340 RepID=UPI001E2B3133|nr:hypothetical protein [Streptomyces sp. UNOC14_S4]MCC3772501.1 hypothetical protein [Streptomyces sp. UNOC14_S4]